MRGTTSQKPVPMFELTEAELQSVAGGDSVSTVTEVSDGTTSYQSTTLSGTGTVVSVAAVASGPLSPPLDLASISFAGTPFTDFPDFCDA